jgi:hypothetical protein
VTRPRAADDFEMVHQRIEELRRETAAAPPEPRGPAHAETALTPHERRFKDRREGLPPPWVPTIFVKKPTSSEIARRFWHTRSGW